MIDFSISSSDGRLRVRIAGHADNMDDGAFNIVCGLVSVVGQVCAYGCMEYGDGYSCIAWTSGHLEFSVIEDKTTLALIDSMHQGLRAIQRDFPACFKES